MNVIMSALEREHPESNKDNVAIVRTEMGRRMEPGLVAVPSLLGGACRSRLVMACANVASLLMARATSRLKETSTQLALGASRGCLVRQFLTESAVLAAFGGVAGTLARLRIDPGISLAHAGHRPARRPRLSPRRPHVRLRRDRVRRCRSALRLAPAFMAVKDAWSAVMTTRSSASASRSFSSVARRVLIGGQIALSVVLLMVGGLFLKSFSRAHDIDLGFNPNHLLLVTIDPLLAGLLQRAIHVNFTNNSFSAFAALPGVASATVATKCAISLRRFVGHVHRRLHRS